MYMYDTYFFTTANWHKYNCFFYRVYNICIMFFKKLLFFFFYQISSRFLQSVSHVWHILLYLYIFMIFSNQIQMFYAK